jgi:hypothetical protein
LVTVRSAEAVIVVLAELALFAVFVSVVEDETVAVLVATVPLATEDDAFTTSENWADCPLSKVGMPQVTVPPDPAPGVLQLAVGPVFCVIDANVMPDGRLSVNVTFCALSGPEFETVRVYVKLGPPAVAVAGALLVTPTSAEATLVDAVALSLSGFGSFALDRNTVFV